MLAVVVLGTVFATVLGWLWLAIDADGQAPGTSTPDRFTQAFLGLVGISGPVEFVDTRDGARAAIALVVLGAAVLLVAFLVALAPADGPHGLDADEGPGCAPCSTGGAASTRCPTSRCATTGR